MQVTVSLRGVLRGYADGRSRFEVELPPEATVADLLDQLRDDLPAVERRVRDERGRIRRHVNVFVDGEEVRRTGGIDAPLHPDAEVLVLPAISGG